jgi:hypothetical protein
MQQWFNISGQAPVIKIFINTDDCKGVGISFRRSCFPTAVVKPNAFIADRLMITLFRSLLSGTFLKWPAFNQGMPNVSK